MSFKKKISILGVTGSIGKSAQSIIISNPNKFDVRVITAGKDVQGLAKAALDLKAKIAIIADETKLADLTLLLHDTGIEARSGQREIENIAQEPVDLILAAIVGFAGLRPILNALQKGINVAIANKEPIVAAGPLIIDAAQKSGAKIIPVDSEHNAIFQVFENHNREHIDKLILTASGGPFRNWTKKQMERATIKEAIKHPNWSMGAKISIDSATMMNKALEVIEAHYLFDMPPEKIEVILHPQSIIHSMVAYKDGSVLAQLGNSDMKIPIAHALSWPNRIDVTETRFDLNKFKTLDFEAPDLHKFPAIGLAFLCLKIGPQACIVMNAANEIAVEAFLNKQISFGDIVRCVESVIGKTNFEKQVKTIEEIEEYDNMARQSARAIVEQL